MWRDYVGTRVTVREDPATGARRCAVAGRPFAGCAPDERAFAAFPPPPYLLTKVLVTYPVPLFPESEAEPGTELHCSA